MDPSGDLVEKLLATTGLSCEDLLAKLQQYRSQKARPTQEATTDSDSTEQSNQEKERCTANSDTSVIFETNSSTVASSETNDVNPQAEPEDKKDERSSAQTKLEDCDSAESERADEDPSTSQTKSENSEDCDSTAKVHSNEDCRQEKVEHGDENCSAVASSNEENQQMSQDADQQTVPEPKVDGSSTDLSSQDEDENEAARPSHGGNNAIETTCISSTPNSTSRRASIEENSTSSASCSQLETNEDTCKDDNELTSTTKIDDCLNQSNVESETENNNTKTDIISEEEVLKKDHDNFSKTDDKFKEGSDGCDNINGHNSDTSQEKSFKTNENHHNTENHQNDKPLNHEHHKMTTTPSSPDSDRPTSPVDEIPKSEDNLRDILRMQLSSLRNMKKSSGCLTDIKKTSMSFQNLKKKRKSCDINPLASIDPDSSTEENEINDEKTLDEPKSISNSNENSLVSLSDQTEFMIVSVTGGVDQLTAVSEQENDRKFEAVTKANEENLSQDGPICESLINVRDGVTTDNSNHENQDVDGSSAPSTSEKTVVVRQFKKKLYSRYDTVSTPSEETSANISINKDISTSFTHDPGVTKSTKNSEKSPFVSDSLEDFLSESAELRVSYPIPKLRAEEGISDTPKPSPFDDMVSKAPKVEQQTVQKEPKLVKAKTLAEMRRHFERLKAGESTPETPSRYKKKLLKQESTSVLKKQKDLDIVMSTTPKNSFIVCDNKKLRVYSKNKDKCVAVINSRVNKENIQELPPSSSPVKQETTPSRRLSLLSSLTQNKPSPVKYKPGPLCKKISLQNTESKARWATELKVLPKIFMEVIPRVHQPIDPKVVHLLPIFDDVIISEERTNFALSMLKPEDATTEPESFTFHIPYINNQEKLLVRRPCKPVESFEDIKGIEPDTNPEAEIAKVLHDIITYVEVKEIAESIVKEDDPIVEPLQSSLEIGPKSKARKIKRNKLDLEMLRLNCKVIDVATKEAENVNCTKLFCRMGCVCKSLLCEGVFSNHCQLVDCMFGCRCPPSNSNEATATNNSLSVHTVNHLEDKAKKNLAKVEREFTQTLIHTDNEPILIGTTKMRRSTKPPKKYTDFVGNDEIFNDVPLKREVLKPKKFDLVLHKLELDDLIPYCLFHHTYDCYCKGEFLDSPSQKAKEAPQIPKIRIVKTKEDQHKAWYDSCARIRKVFPEYKERNKNPVYNQKLRKTFFTERKFLKKKQTEMENNVTISHETPEAPTTSKPSKRKQSFVIRDDGVPTYSLTNKPDREFALQRRKKKIKPNINFGSFNSSLSSPVASDVASSSSPVDVEASPPYSAIFEGEIKISVKDNKEVLNIVGSEKEFLRILPWNKLIENYKSGKICIWAREKGPTTVMCNSAGHLPPKNFVEIKKASRRNDIIEWILTDTLPGISRELMHLLLTPKNNHFLIPGYCLKKMTDETQIETEQGSKDAQQHKQESLLINRPGGSTTQPKPTENGQFMYKFSTPKALTTTKQIAKVEDRIKLTLDSLESKKKTPEQKPQSVSLLPNQSSPARKYNKRILPKPRQPDASTPTIQQVLNSHRLELSQKRTSPPVPTENPKRIRSEKSAALTKIFEDDVSGIELLELLDSSSKKRDAISNEKLQDPLDLEIQTLLDESNKKRANVDGSITETVSRDPLEISEPSSPDTVTGNSGKKSEDPLDLANEPGVARPVSVTPRGSSSERDPLEIIPIDQVTVEKPKVKSPPVKSSLKNPQLSQISKKPTVKNRQTPQGCLIPSRSLKCTHKDMNNRNKTLILTNKVFMKRKLFCNEDKTAEITLPLPPVSKNLKWRMIYLNSDFTFLTFVLSNYSIKYTDLLDVTRMSGNIKSTITLRNKEFSDHYKHPLFGIYCVPDYQDCLFIGPFFPMEKLLIETLRYLQGRLIDTVTFDRMVGKTRNEKSPKWLYEHCTKPVGVLSKGIVIDITEDDDGNDVNVVNLDSDSSEETQNVAVNPSDNNLLCPPFVEEVTSEELSSHSVNRYIVTNIPHLGYFRACQRDSQAIDVFWPGTSKGYRFPNVTFAKNLLTQYLSQIFCPIPQDFKINVIIMTNLGIQSNKPIDPKYFSNSGLYFCGEFGIYEKDTLPEELLVEYNVESVDKLVKLHREVQKDDDAMVRLFGLFLMSNEELRRHSKPDSILQWAISEIYVLKKLSENYDAEKADLQNIFLRKSKQLNKKRQWIPRKDDRPPEPKRIRMKDTPAGNSRLNLTETIEIKDSDDEEETPTPGQAAPVFKKISTSGKVPTEVVYGGDKGRSLLKSNVWMQKGRSLLKTNSTAAQVLPESSESSSGAHPVTISLNNSNVVLNKNKMLITKLK